MATGGQLLDNGSPPNQIPASKLPHYDRAHSTRVVRLSRAEPAKRVIRNALKKEKTATV
jgi:hypothetical protein